jgi:alkylated DNA repair dioxygenase AlkB
MLLEFVSKKRIINTDGIADYYHKLIEVDYQAMHQSIDWHEEYLTLYGKKILVPRLVGFHGDSDVAYRYSGRLHVANKWTPKLLALKQQMCDFLLIDFNCVLANLYRDGNDYMGWHSDDEAMLGDSSVIASLSLGESRVFKFKHKVSGEVVNVNLHDGDVLIMGGRLQENWVHCIPKTKKRKQPRINFTFRKII